MNSKQKIELPLIIYLVFYILLYIFLLGIITILHSSFSMVSIPAITLPFLLLIIWCLFLFKKSLDFDRKKILKRILYTCSIPPLICLILLGINESTSRFSVDRWAIKADDRVYIVDDLLNNHKLKGMKKKEVHDLLGSPDNVTDNNLIYYLGTERGLVRIDSELLVIQFNDKNVVTNYSITKD